MISDPSLATPTPATSFWSSAIQGATFLSRGVRWGLLCGAAIGGVGGRVAMLVLRLTSDDSVIGVKSDDDFVIGRFSAETIFLVLLAAALGAVGGLIYLLAREWLPRHGRAVMFGLLCATVMGSAIISPDGVDFTRLSPLWLAVTMFVLIPAAYGATVSLLIERSIRLDGGHRGFMRWIALLPLGVLLLSGPFFLAALALFVAVLVANRSGHLTRAWRSTPARWLGHVVLIMVFLLTSVALVNDIVDVL
jgi:hypothetical protein